MSADRWFSEGLIAGQNAPSNESSAERLTRIRAEYGFLLKLWQERRGARTYRSFCSGQRTAQKERGQ